MQGCVCTPGPERSNSPLFLADCLEVLSQLPDQSVP